MSIKEKDLQTIESLSEGDKIRVVTSEGNSRNIDASEVCGDDPFVFTISYDGSTYSCDKTRSEIVNAIDNGSTVIAKYERYMGGLLYEYNNLQVHYSTGTLEVIYFRSGGQNDFGAFSLLFISDNEITGTYFQFSLQ